jgi:hypothetical protein
MSPATHYLTKKSDPQQIKNEERESKSLNRTHQHKSTQNTAYSKQSLERHSKHRPEADKVIYFEIYFIIFRGIAISVILINKIYYFHVV